MSHWPVWVFSICTVALVFVSYDLGSWSGAVWGPFTGVFSVLSYKWSSELEADKEGER